MTNLFSNEWMAQYEYAWNHEPGLSDELAKIGFTAVIGYGFENEPQPAAVLIVRNGKAIFSGIYQGQDLQWDLRASPDNWQRWVSKPPNIMTLGVAYTSGKLKFQKGDYLSIVKDLRMAGPFIKSFAAMGQVQ